MLVQYILNNVSVSGIKLLCKYKADPSIQQMKDEIYIKLIDLELNKPLVDEIVQMKRTANIAELEPEIRIDPW